MKFKIQSLVRSVGHGSFMGLVVATAFSFAVNAQVPTQTPMQEAATLGTGKGQEVFNNVTSKMPDSSTVPGYNGTEQQQKNLYQGGKGELVGPGVNRAGACAQANDTECQAVNLLQWGPNNRPAPTFSANDPLLVGARQKMSNAKTSLGTFGTSAGTTAGLLTQTVTQCETKTIVTPATYETSVCDETAQLENKTCNVDQTVKVDAQYDYLCEKTIERKTTQSCNKTLDVTCSGATPLQTCPDGAPLINGRCRATVETREEATYSGFTCGEGYQPSGTECVKTVTVTATVASYTCPAGSTVSGSSCITTTTTTQAGSPVYSCPAGSTLSGSNCLSSESIAASVASYSCPAGSTVSGSSCLTTESITPTSNNTCPSGYTLSGSSCVRTVTSSATPAYSCSSGYTLSGSTCTRQVSSAASVASYNCPANYTLSGSTCSLTTSSTSSATPVYTCSGGYTLSGSLCTLQTSQPAVHFYICSPGSTLVNQTCVNTITSVAVRACLTPFTQKATYTNGNFFCFAYRSGAVTTDPRCKQMGGVPTFGPLDNKTPSYCGEKTPSYVCPSGYNLSGGQCVQTTSVNAEISYSCPADYTLSGSSCVKTVTVTATVASYTCPAGSTVSGSSCITTTTTTQAGSPVYSCPAGSTLSGSNCLSSESIAASVASYSCPAGSTVSGSSCLTTESITPTSNNTCPSGYTLSGSSCVRTVTSSATPAYSCSSGYTLSGSTCTRQVSSAASVASYNCPANYTLSGSTCSLTTSSTSSATPVYTCSDGFTLSGSTCSRQLTEPGTPQYSCRPGGTLIGTMCKYLLTTDTNPDVSYTCPVSGVLTATSALNGNTTYSCCVDSFQNACQGLEAKVQ